GEWLFVQLADGIRVFRVSGNTLTPQPLAETRLRQLLGAEQIVALRADAQGLLVLDDSGLHRITRDGSQWTVNTLHVLAGGVALARVGEALVIADDRGGLTRLDRRGAFRLPATRPIAALAVAGTDVLAALTDGRTLAVFDAGTAGTLQSLGDYSLPALGSTLVM